MAQTYRSLDDVNRLLSDVWATYPAVYATASPATQNISLAVIPAIIERSRDYCAAVSSGQTDIDVIAKGGFGEVGPFRIQEDGGMRRVFMHVVSFRDEGRGWVPYYAEVVAKRTLSNASQALYLLVGVNAQLPGRVMYISNDFLHESIIGSLVSHLYDVGVLPGVTKYFGTFVCKAPGPPGLAPPEKYNNATLMEKSSLELLKVLGYASGSTPAERGGMWNASLGRKFFLQLNVYDLMIWMSQLAHTFFTMKLYFGISHFDTHLRNVMLTYVKNSGLSLNGPDTAMVTSVYGGKLLSEVDYIRYELPFIDGEKGKAYLIVENNGLLPKLIDYGITVADFPSSARNNDLAFRFENSTDVYASVHGGREAALNTNGYGDVEYNFTGYNMLFQLYRIAMYRDVYGVSAQDSQYARDLLAAIRPFLERTIGQFDLSQSKTDLSGRDFRLDSQFDKPDGSWFMSYRDVGTTASIIAPLYKIYAYLQSVGSVVPGKPTTVYITRSGKAPPPNVPKSRVLNVSLNPPKSAKKEGMSEYLVSSKKYYQMCLLNGGIANPDRFSEMARSLEINPPVPLTNTGRAEVCLQVQRKSSKLKPTVIRRKGIFKYTLGQTNAKVWDAAKNTLKDGITIADLTPEFLSVNIAGKIAIFNINLYPRNVAMGELNPSGERLAFQASQRMLDRNAPPPEELDREMKSVGLRIVYYRNGSGGVTMSLGGDVFDAAQTSLASVPAGISVSGGFFVMKRNITNTLTPGLEPYQGRPIGFYFDRFNPHLSGTSLPVPTAYKKDWGVIMASRGTIQLGRYSTFINKHYTEKVKAQYQLAKNDQTNTANPDGSMKLYNTTVTRIKLFEDGMPRLKSGAPLPYDFVMASGPILVWNGQVVITRKKLEFSNLVIDVMDSPPENGSPTYENGSYYKLLASAENASMYYAEEGEKWNNFIYGQRNSNSLSAHNVICQTNSGDILFVFVEGLGFNSLGLDRAQLAALVAKFDVKTAIALDGGFDVNGVLKTISGEYQWLMPATEYQRPIGTHINIGL